MSRVLFNQWEARVGASENVTRRSGGTIRLVLNREDFTELDPTAARAVARKLNKWANVLDPPKPRKRKAT